MSESTVQNRGPRWEAASRGRIGWGALSALLGGLLVGLASCANPVPPSGGPRDEIPPSIVQTRPGRDSVNVSTDTRSVYVEFSEYVERSSLTQSLSITPRFDQRIRFDWSGRGVNIELPTRLRDSTTYILSFDTNLQDAHGVSLDRPLTVAFSTGPRINQGEIRGRVVDPRRAEPQSRVDIFAYTLPRGATAPPDSLPDRPAYRTQTGENGRFAFNYLRERRYYVVALRDNNRNRQPDPPEPFGVPPRVALAATPDTASVPVPWLLTQADTTGPRFQQVDPLSRRRLRLSFNEAVRVADRRPSQWRLRDSVANARVPVRAVYRSPARTDAVILRTGRMDTTRHTLPLVGDLVTDTLGQGVVPDTARFQGVERPDTTRTRFRAFVPEDLPRDTVDGAPLLPGVHPGVRFNQPPDSSVLPDVLSLQDTTGQPRSDTIVTEEGRTYQVRGRPPLQPGEVVEVAVNLRPIAGPDTTYRRRFRRVTRDVLGALEGRAVIVPRPYANRLAVGVDSASADSLASDATADPTAGDTSSAPMHAPAGAAPDSAADSLVVEIIATQSSIPVDRRQLTIAPESTFVFEDLPEGTFRFRAYRDRNGNGRWDGGLIQPYTPAEPITWSEGTTDSRPRWTNVISTPLRVPVLRPGEEGPSASAPDTAATGLEPAVPDTTAPVSDTTSTDTLD